jgi:hypothetical protein
MGRYNSQSQSERAKRQEGPLCWKRERPNRRQAPPPTLNVDVHGVLFAVVFVVFVVYPLAQWARGR